MGTLARSRHGGGGYSSSCESSQVDSPCFRRTPFGVAAASDMKSRQSSATKGIRSGFKIKYYRNLLANSGFSVNLHLHSRGRSPARPAIRPWPRHSCRLAGPHESHIGIRSLAETFENDRQTRCTSVNGGQIVNELRWLAKVPFRAFGSSPDYSRSSGTEIQSRRPCGLALFPERREMSPELLHFRLDHICAVGLEGVVAQVILMVVLGRPEG